MSLHINMLCEISLNHFNVLGLILLDLEDNMYFFYYRSKMVLDITSLRYGSSCVQHKSGPMSKRDKLVKVNVTVIFQL